MLSLFCPTVVAAKYGWAVLPPAAAMSLGYFICLVLTILIRVSPVYSECEKRRMIETLELIGASLAGGELVLALFLSL